MAVSRPRKYPQRPLRLRTGLGRSVTVCETCPSLRRFVTGLILVIRHELRDLPSTEFQELLGLNESAEWEDKENEKVAIVGCQREIKKL